MTRQLGRIGLGIAIVLALTCIFASNLQTAQACLTCLDWGKAPCDRVMQWLYGDNSPVELTDPCPKEDDRYKSLIFLPSVNSGPPPIVDQVWGMNLDPYQSTPTLSQLPYYNERCWTLNAGQDGPVYFYSPHDPNIKATLSWSQADGFTFISADGKVLVMQGETAGNCSVMISDLNTGEAPEVLSYIGDPQLTGIDRGPYHYGWTYGIDTNDGAEYEICTVKLGETTVRTEYTHYIRTEGILTRKRVTVEEYNSDGSKRFSTNIYGYTIKNGIVVIQYVVDPEGVKRFLVKSGIVGINPDHPECWCYLDDTSVTCAARYLETDQDVEGKLAYYCSARYDYYPDDDINRKGKVKTLAGQGCSSCGGAGGEGIYTFDYGTSSEYSSELDYYTADSAESYNVWQNWQRTKMPGNLRKLEFSNKYGHLVYQILYTVADPAANPEVVTTAWITHYKYDYKGRVIEVRHPSACKSGPGYDGYLNSTALGALSGSSPDPSVYGDWSASNPDGGRYTEDKGIDGLVEMTGYDGNGNMISQQVRQGTDINNSAPLWIREYTYTAVTSRVGSTIYLPASTIEYFKETPTHGDSTATVTTTHNYSFYPSSNVIMTDTITYPSVDTNSDGSGAHTSLTRYFTQVFDEAGHVSQYYNNWTKREDGSYSYQKLNDKNQVSTEIEDVNTTLGNPALPSVDGWDSRTGANLTTVYTYEDSGTYENSGYNAEGYYASGLVSTITSPSQTTSKYWYMSCHDSQAYYVKGATTRLVTMVAPFTNGSNYSYAPMQITVTDMAGRTILSASGNASNEDGNMANDWHLYGAVTIPWNESTTSPSSIVNLFQGTLVSLAASSYDIKGHLTTSDRYWNIPSSGLGAKGTNYYETTYTYYDDTTGQQKDVTAEDGTITRTEYDLAGRSCTTSMMDTSDNSWKTISQTYYDGSTTTDTVAGDGNVTQTVSYINDSGATYATDYDFDFRDRQRQVRQPGYATGAYTTTLYTLDNLGHATTVETYCQADGDWPTLGSGTRLSKSDTCYDAKGQVWKALQYAISSTGAPGNTLATCYWYDKRGRQIKTQNADGLFTKTQYDGAGRVTGTYVCYDDSEQSGAASSSDGSDWASASNVDNDVVIHETKTQYDATYGNAWFTASYDRKETAANLGDLANTNLSANSFARANFSASWFAQYTNRLIASALYGTNFDPTVNDYNPDTTEVDAYTAGSPPTVNTSYEAKMVMTKYDYDSAGQLWKTTDNSGKVTQKSFDNLGRVAKVVENYQEGAHSGDADANRTTEYAFDNVGRLKSMTAYPSCGEGGTPQTTCYFYQNTLNCGWVTDVVYPDAVTDDVRNGDPSGASRVHFEYDWMGRKHTVADQRGVVHTYAYTAAGMLQADTIYSDLSPTGVDDTVKSITYSYDAWNRLHFTTCRGNATDDPNDTTLDPNGHSYIRNQIINLYSYGGNNGFGMLTQQTLDVDSKVTGGTGTPARNVYYYYTDSNHPTRLTSVKYPSNKQIYYLYDDADTLGSDKLSRVTALAKNSARGTNDANVIVSYKYLGVGQMVNKSYPNVDPNTDQYADKRTKLDYTTSDYSGLDSFGRIVKQVWTNSMYTMFDIEHGYDRDSNRLYANNPLIYKSSSQFYGYDSLNRLTSAKAGLTTLDNSSGMPNGIDNSWLGREQDWTLDQVGNQTSVADFGASAWYTGNFNTANEFAETSTYANDARAVKAQAKPALFSDDFNGTTAMANHGDGTATSGSDALVITGLATDHSQRAIVLVGDDIGPAQIETSVQFSSLTDGDFAGIIFGYTGPSDYYMLVQEQVSGNTQRSLYQVVSGTASLMGSSEAETLVTNAWNAQLATQARNRSVRLVTHELALGTYPFGKVGLITNTNNAKFRYFRVHQNSLMADVAGRWSNNAGHWGSASDPHDGAAMVTVGGNSSLKLESDGASVVSPILFKYMRLGQTSPARMYRVEFSVNRPDSNNASLKLIFNAKNQSTLNYIRINHSTTAISPTGGACISGVTESPVSFMSPGGDIPTSLSSSDTLWVRMDCDPNLDPDYSPYANIYLATSRAGLDSAAAWQVDFSATPIAQDGGFVGFCADKGTVNVGNFTVKTTSDVTKTNWTTEMVDDFSRTSDTPEYDAAGNMTYDGLFQYKYNGWNQMTQVIRAWRDSIIWPYALQSGSTIATISYDGLGRRIQKAVTNSGDWTCTNNYYYDGQRMIDEYLGSFLRRQYVWGPQYVDELVQVNLPSNKDFWACQDSNYNVLGLVDSGGDLIERYEYTPYGQRTIFAREYNSNTAPLPGDANSDGVVDFLDFQVLLDHYQGSGGWAQGDFSGDGTVDFIDFQILLDHWQQGLPDISDPLVTMPTMERGTTDNAGGMSSSTIRGISEVGHQGLMHDKEFGQVYNRARMYNPTMGRFLQRDPIGHVDGMNLYQYVRSTPATYVDPTGQFGKSQHIDITTAAWNQTGLQFQPAGALDEDDLTVMIKTNWNTDFTRTVQPSYHAQDIAFVKQVKDRMDSIKGRKCWKNWAWRSGDWSTLNDMGTALHIIQDFYSHSDWVEGTNMKPVYASYGDKAMLAAMKNGPNAGTISLANLEKGNNSEFKNTILYSGGVNIGDWAKEGDPHDRYTADAPGEGRDRVSDTKKGVYGLGGNEPWAKPGAYKRASNAAIASSKEFILWAKNNMTKCCCEILFGAGNCNNNKN